MDEEYDELSMGPMGGGNKSLPQEDPAPLPSVRRSGPSSAPPPTLFHSMPDRWAQRDYNDAETKQSTGRASNNIMSFEEEEEEEEEAAASPAGIRQEALRMLQVADSGTYSVHRTVTGGFQAEPRSMGHNKRIPTALAGLGSFATPRSNKPRVPTVYRDDPQTDYEYGESPPYDVDRFADSHVREEKKENSSTWSSRYSVDDTLLKMSGGSVRSPPNVTTARQSSSSSFLDKLDAAHDRRTARNLFGKSPAKNANVFGAGFNFRQKSVFGQQGAASDANLRTVWMDAGASASPARSWMDDLRDKRTRRRNYLILAALLGAFLVTLVTVLGARRSSSSTATDARPARWGPDGQDVALTFYVTSDVPYASAEQDVLAEHLQTMHDADFFVHLGNIQEARRSLCRRHRYQSVAALLRTAPLPTFVLPGQEDWPNCPDQDEAWEYWKESFLEFDDYFHKRFDLWRQEDYLENFAFIDRDVMFIAVHETNGRVDDEDELWERNTRNVEWVEGIINTFMDDDTRALVIFGNGRPLMNSNNDFYLGLANVLYKLDIPVAYIHGNDADGDRSVTYKPYDMPGMDHVIAIQSSRGGTNDLMRIHVGWDDTDPFIIG